MKLFDDSENTDNSVGLPKHSGSIPDRIYHKLRVTPSNLAVFKLLYRAGNETPVKTGTTNI